MGDGYMRRRHGGRLHFGFLQGVRLPGSGGACEIAILAREVVVVLPQTRRAFPERVGFLTSPGHLDGGDARRRAGYPGAGPTRVITDLGLYGFVDGEMTLESLHPGVTLERVRAETGWPLRVADDLATTPEPTAEELATLRALGTA
jgi:glutaconate CoA-transferase subunit B